jgi:soluble lytic murein transglycosylase-like protein
MPLRLAILVPLVALTCGFTLVLDRGARDGPVAPALAAQVHTPAAAPPAASCPLPERFRTAFALAAADATLPLALLVAVAKMESGFRADARSPAGAEGLLQVLPSTAAELELDASRPAENVLAGARYLREMLDRFGSADLALAAYNAGPAAVDERGGRPYDETVAYVERVTAEWRKLLGCA